MFEVVAYALEPCGERLGGYGNERPGRPPVLQCPLPYLGVCGGFVRRFQIERIIMIVCLAEFRREGAVLRFNVHVNVIVSSPANVFEGLSDIGQRARLRHNGHVRHKSAVRVGKYIFRYPPVGVGFRLPYRLLLL